MRLRAGGICGSDLPSFLGRRNPFVDSLGDAGLPAARGRRGSPRTGARIVGWAEGHKGLAEYFVAREDAIVELDDELTDVEATVVQPLCTVLHQLDRVDVAGKRVAVDRAGADRVALQPCVKARGAAHVTGVDRVDRSDCAAAFGVDEVVWDDAAAWARGRRGATSSSRPSATTPARSRPRSRRSRRTAPCSPSACPTSRTTRSRSPPSSASTRTLIAGAATDRARALADAREYLREHKALLAPYVTNVLAVEQAQEAFELAVGPGRRAAQSGARSALMRFTATLEDRYVIVPFDVRERWGEARPPVAGTINGVPFRTRIAVYGGQSVLGLTNAIRKQAGVVQGDEVEIELERDDAPREIELPPSSSRAERRRARASMRSVHARREYAEWVAEAKRPETRERRAAQTVEKLSKPG